MAVLEQGGNRRPICAPGWMWILKSEPVRLANELVLRVTERRQN